MSMNQVNQHKLNCIICNKNIQGFYIYDEWGNNAHKAHQINYCFSCQRIIANKSTSGGVQHPDGRTLCNKCYRVAVKRDHQINQVYSEIIELFKKAGINNISLNIPIKLIDRVEIEKLSGSIYTEGMARRSSYNYAYSPQTVSWSIYILSYLPRIQFKGVLAHELLHIWLAEQNIKLGTYEEAFCNIGSTLVYNTNRKDALAYYLNERMKTDNDPAYGVRFMELKSKLKQLGWRRFIKKIKQF